MSNKLFNMFELISLGYPHNKFYVLDMNNVPPSEVNSFLKDGLRNFKSLGTPRKVCIRTAVSGNMEMKLFLAPNIDGDDDEIILEKMKEGLKFISKKFNNYSNAFLIIQEWTPESEYLFSLNLLSTKKGFLVEGVKGNHSLIGKKGTSLTIIKFNNKINLIKSGLMPNELIKFNRLIRSLIKNYIFKQDYIYELSFIKKGVVFYNIKKPENLKNYLNKTKFYDKLKQKGINYYNNILKYHN